jgi:hypothetical protein
MHPAVILLALCAIAAAAFVQAFQKRQSLARRLPPGPKPELLGNTLPRLYPWRGFYELSKKYGGLITVWNGFSPLVICSDVQS